MELKLIRNSNEPEFTQGFWKHQRFYGDWKRDKYQFPIDKVRASNIVLWQQ